MSALAVLVVIFGGLLFRRFVTAHTTDDGPLEHAQVPAAEPEHAAKDDKGRDLEDGAEDPEGNDELSSERDNGFRCASAIQDRGCAAA